MSANMLRDRAKKHIATLRTDFLLCPAADYQADRRRAAPLVALLVRAVEQYRPHHCWKLNWQKKCWTMQTWST